MRERGVEELEAGSVVECGGSCITSLGQVSYVVWPLWCVRGLLCATCQQTGVN